MFVDAMPRDRLLTPRFDGQCSALLAMDRWDGGFGRDASTVMAPGGTGHNARHDRPEDLGLRISLDLRNGPGAVFIV